MIWYVICIRELKQALNHGLNFKKFHKGIKFNQNAWLKRYIDMNKDIRKNDFKKVILSWWMMPFLEKLY